LETENITSGCKNTGYALVNLTAGSNIQAGFGYDELPSNKKTTGYPVDFVAITHGDAAKLKWSFGDGEYDSTNTNPTHEYDTAGEYTACLQIWDPITGETDEYCELVKVGQGSNIKNISAETFTTLTNYPNPFKEITHIVFTLNYKTIVNLAVYNTEGELIKTIINTVKTAGDHRIIWNGGQLKTGVYYLQLMTNEGIQTKKMIKE